MLLDENPDLLWYPVLPGHFKALPDMGNNYQGRKGGCKFIVWILPCLLVLDKELGAPQFAHVMEGSTCLDKKGVQFKPLSSSLCQGSHHQ